MFESVYSGATRPVSILTVTTSTSTSITHPIIHASPTAHGEYWIATEFARFFREWLDYDAANTIFKDTPAATSRYEDATRIDFGVLRLQQEIHDGEADLAQHLDDFIARAVVTTDEGGGEFLQELLLGRTWHLPATGDVLTACPADGRCPTGQQCSVLGDCRPTNLTTQATYPLLFSHEDPIPTEQTARWVEVDANERLGVLTHPAWLAAHGGNFEDDASLVHRGKWIREQLFCQTVPPLSLVEVDAKLGPSAPDLSARDRVRMATEENPTCLTCHQLMNPLGAPFELFNHAGFFRATDHGRAPDGSTTIDNIPIAGGEDLNGEYASPFELIRALAASQLIQRSFIRHAFRYFMGRDETLADSCTLAAMETAYEEAGSFVDMMAALVRSDTFVNREAAQ